MGLYRRKDSPFWWMSLSLPGGRGRWVSTKVPWSAPSSEQRAQLKKNALAVYAHAQATLTLDRRGLTPRPARTLREQIAWYTPHVSTHKRGARREAEILARLLTDLGDLALTDLTIARVTEWRTRRRETVSASTVNRELDVLKHVLVSAVPEYLETSPLAKMPRLRAAKHDLAILSRDDERKLLKVLAPADRTLVIAALDTLMRLGDLLNLPRAQDHGTYLSVPDPKTGHAYRVPVSSRLRAALNRLPSGEFLFQHRRTGIRPENRANSVKQMFETACQAAGVAYGRPHGITFHALRHTGATRMIQAGVDIRTVMAIGGWKSLRMLERYLHPTDAASRAAVEKIGRRR